MLKKIIMATLASLLTTTGMFLIYKAYTKRKIQTQKVMRPSYNESANVDLPTFKKALAEVKRRDPGTLPGITPELNFLLKREKCEIPYTDESKNTATFIKGHFATTQQLDSAALCITPENELTIKIGWGGKIRPCSQSIAYGLLRRYIRPYKSDAFLFQRVLLKADFKRLDYYTYQNNIPRPPPGIEGLEDRLSSDESIILYCQNKEWRAIPVLKE